MGVIVLMHNINDRLWLGIKGNYAAKLRNYGATTGEAVINSLQSLISSLVDFFAYRSNTVFLLRYWDNKAAAWLDHKPTNEVSEHSIQRSRAGRIKAASEIRTEFSCFVAVVRALGKRPVLMTQPLGRYSIAQKKFNNSIRMVARNEHVYLIDLARSLGSDHAEDFFADKIHLNNSGSYAVGKFIAAKLATFFSASTDEKSISRENTDSGVPRSALFRHTAGGGRSALMSPMDKCCSADYVWALLL